jgi:hypothetical protein
MVSEIGITPKMARSRKRVNVNKRNLLKRLQLGIVRTKKLRLSSSIQTQPKLPLLDLVSFLPRTNFSITSHIFSRKTCNWLSLTATTELMPVPMRIPIFTNQRRSQREVTTMHSKKALLLQSQLADQAQVSLVLSLLLLEM